MGGDIKIKGKGETRTVWLDGVQIGTVHQHKRKVMAGRVMTDLGARERMTEVSTWTAKHMDGKPVRYRNDGVIRSEKALCRWQSLTAWGVCDG